MTTFNIFWAVAYLALGGLFVSHALRGDVFFRPDTTTHAHLFSYYYYPQAGHGGSEGLVSKPGQTPTRSGGAIIYYGPYRGSSGSSSGGSSSGGSSGGSSGFHK